MPRIKVQDAPAVYHCVSRIVGGERLLGDLEKEKLVQLLLRLAEFCGVEVITYCILSNHFHVLIRVPVRATISDAEILGRLIRFYGERAVLTTLAREGLEQRGGIDGQLREQLLSRMGDLSLYMKELKERFSRWYNRRHGRFGTLWAERFTSVLVEDSPGCLRTVAAYIDLNPVRAGLVKDPKDYRYCGYSAALVGDPVIRRFLGSMFEADGWDKAAAEYRQLLFVTGGVAGHAGKAVLERDAIRAELARGGRLELGEILRLRIRHLTDGVALGSREFVNEVFGRYRDRFSSRRRDGARRIRGISLPELHVLRDLRVNAIE